MSAIFENSSSVFQSIPFKLKKSVESILGAEWTGEIDKSVGPSHFLLKFQTNQVGVQYTNAILYGSIALGIVVALGPDKNEAALLVAKYPYTYLVYTPDPFNLTRFSCTPGTENLLELDLISFSINQRTIIRERYSIVSGDDWIPLLAKQQIPATLLCMKHAAVEESPTINAHRLMAMQKHNLRFAPVLIPTLMQLIVIPEELTSLRRVSTSFIEEIKPKQNVVSYNNVKYGYTIGINHRGEVEFAPVDPGSSHIEKTYTCTSADDWADQRQNYWASNVPEFGEVVIASEMTAQCGCVYLFRKIPAFGRFLNFPIARKDLVSVPKFSIGHIWDGVQNVTVSRAALLNAVGILTSATTRKSLRNLSDLQNLIEDNEVFSTLNANIRAKSHLNVHGLASEDDTKMLTSSVADLYVAALTTICFRARYMFGQSDGISAWSAALNIALGEGRLKEITTLYRMHDPHNFDLSPFSVDSPAVAENAAFLEASRIPEKDCLRDALQKAFGFTLPEGFVYRTRDVERDVNFLQTLLSPFGSSCALLSNTDYFTKMKNSQLNSGIYIIKYENLEADYHAVCNMKQKIKLSSYDTEALNSWFLTGFETSNLIQADLVEPGTWEDVNYVNGIIAAGGIWLTTDKTVFEFARRHIPEAHEDADIYFAFESSGINLSSLWVLPSYLRSRPDVRLVLVRVKHEFLNRFFALSVQPQIRNVDIPTFYGEPMQPLYLENPERGYEKNATIVDRMLALADAQSQVVYSGCADFGGISAIRSLIDMKSPATLVLIDVEMPASVMTAVHSAQQNGFKVVAYASTADAIANRPIRIQRPKTPVFPEYLQPPWIFVHADMTEYFDKNNLLQFGMYQQLKEQTYAGFTKWVNALPNYIYITDINALREACCLVVVSVGIGPSNIAGKEFFQVINGVSYRITVTKRSHNAYLAAINTLWVLNNSRVNSALTEMPARFYDQTDDEYNLECGRILNGNIRYNNQIVHSRFHYDRPYALYSDACTMSEDIFDLELQANANWFLSKLRVFRLGQTTLSTLVLPPDCELFLKFNASHTEFMYGRSVPVAFDVLRASHHGFEVHTGIAGFGLVRTYDVKSMVLQYSRCALRNVCHSRYVCLLHTFGQGCSDTLRKHICKIQHREKTVPSNLGQFLQSVSAYDAESLFYSILPTQRMNNDVSILSHYTQMYKHFERLHLHNVRNGVPLTPAQEKYNKALSFRLNNPCITFATNPMISLMAKGHLMLIQGPGGSGKTTICANKKWNFTAPFAHVVHDQQNNYFTAETFEVYIANLILADDMDEFPDIEGTVCDEFQAYGPALFVIAYLMNKHKKKLALTGDINQNHFFIPADLKLTPYQTINHPDIFKEVLSLVQPNNFLKMPINKTMVSYRYNEYTARLASSVIKENIVGLGKEGVRIVLQKDIEDVMRMIEFSNPNAPIICLTSDVADFFKKTFPARVVMTSTQSGGLSFQSGNENVDRQEFIGVALALKKALPYHVNIGGRQVDTAFYTLITRGNGVVYTSIGMHSLCLNSLDELASGPKHATTEFCEKSVSRSDGKLIAGFSVGRAVEILAPNPRDVVKDMVAAGLDAVHVKTTTATVADFVVKSKPANLTGNRVIRIGGKSNLSQNADFWKKIKSSKSFDLDVSDLEQLIRRLTGDKADELNEIMSLLRRESIPRFVREKSPWRVVDPFIRQSSIYGSHAFVTDEGPSEVSLVSNIISFGGVHTFITDYMLDVPMDPTFRFEPEKNEYACGLYIDSTFESTGQFHAEHLTFCEQVIVDHFETLPIVDGVFHHGQMLNLREKIVKCHAPSVKLRPDAFFEPNKEYYADFLTHNVSALIHKPTPGTVAAAALARYAPLSRTSALKCMTIPAAEKHDLKLKTHAFAVLEFVKTFFVRSEMDMTNVLDLIIINSINFLNDQGHKNLCIAPDLESMMFGPNKLTQGAKDQLKHPSSLKFGTAKGDKCYQPVVNSPPAWMEHIAGKIRTLVSMFCSACGPNFQFACAGFSMDNIYDKLRPRMHFSKLFGIDIKECDSSHWSFFIELMRQLSKEIFPKVSTVWFDEIYDYMHSVMDVWFTRSLDGTFKATVMEQLASGLAWTFFWNCMWSLFNICAMIIEVVPSEELEAIKGKIVIPTAGDDGLIDFPADFNIPAAMLENEYVNVFGVVLKLEFTPGAAEFCHKTWSPDSLAVDILRVLGKLLSRPFKNGCTEIDEMKQAVFVTIRPYLNAEYRAKAVNAICTTHKTEPHIVLEVFDCLHRFCNTPAHKIEKFFNHTLVVNVNF